MTQLQSTQLDFGSNLTSFNCSGLAPTICKVVGVFLKNSSSHVYDQSLVRHYIIPDLPSEEFFRYELICFMPYLFFW